MPKNEREKLNYINRLYKDFKLNEGRGTGPVEKKYFFDMLKGFSLNELKLLTRDK